MPVEKFKFPQSSYDELTKIIKAYAQFDKPATLDDISKMIGLHKTIISSNAGFLVEIGILEEGLKKQSTPEGKKLALALLHEQSRDVSRFWRELVCINDFLAKLITAIQIRKGMDENTFEAHIVYSAGQPKSSRFMTGARTIIDILRTANLIEETNGKITTMTEPISPSASQSGEVDDLRLSADIVDADDSTVQVSSKPHSFIIDIHINVNCSPNDLDNLGVKIKSIIEEVSSSRNTISKGS